jgi:hypothetical protein
MRTFIRFLLSMFLWSSFLLGTAVASAQETPETPETPAEPQTRGPIHEAFAQPLEAQAKPGMAVPNEPPASIREIPPDEQPQGKNIQWVPGYWAWDADKSSFLWVSGFYRDAPPGRSYVPGYWTKSDAGWRWVSGFWGAAQQETPPTVAEPPESLEMGPSTPPPDDNSSYLPGIWMYRDGRYAWRPGYWAAFQPGQVWVPAQYYWTPGGYIFVDGYWDLPIENRGLLFAPVAFAGSPWQDPSWFFTPSFVISPSAICDCAFYRPCSGHIFFGNFFGAGHRTLGFRPWCSGLGRFDPALGHFCWRHHGTASAFAAFQRTFQVRQQATFAVQQASNLRVQTVKQFSQSSKVTIVRSTSTQVNVHRSTVQHTRQLAVTRQQREASVAKTTTVTAASVKSSSVAAASVKQSVAAKASSSVVRPAIQPTAAPHVAHASPAAHTAPKFTQSMAHNASAVHAVAKSSSPAMAHAAARSVAHAAPVARAAPRVSAPAHRAVHTAQVHRAASVSHAARGGHGGRRR